MSEQLPPCPNWMQEAAREICDGTTLGSVNYKWAARVIAMHASRADEGQAVELKRFIEDKVAHSKFESDGGGGIRYYLTERDIKQARELVAPAPSTTPPEPAVKCPECGHKRICFDEDYQCCMFVVGRSGTDRFCKCSVALHSPAPASAAAPESQ